MHLTLLRHARATGNEQNLLQGRLDYPLSAAGEDQAQALGRYWSKLQAAGGMPRFDAILASPQIRARRTAEIVGEALGLAVELDEVWVERDVGCYSGMTGEALEQALLEKGFMDVYTPWGEHGESRWDIYLRAGRALQRLMSREPGRYLIVSHGGTLNMFLYVVLGIAPQPNRSGPGFHFDNTGYANLAYYPKGNRWDLLSFNETPHLKDGMLD